MSRFLNYIDEVCDGTGTGSKDGTGEKKRKRKGKEENIEENTLNEKISIQFRISPKGSKMRMVKNLDQIFKDYTREEVKDANIDVVVNGEVIGSFGGSKLSYHIG